MFYALALVFLVNQGANGQIESMPAGRSQHAMTFDTDKNMLLVFGGSTHPKNVGAAKVGNELWGWKDSKWRILSTAGPTPREDAKFVYHKRNHRAYLYGGRTYDMRGNAVVSSEFWEWDGSSWTLLTAAAAPGKLLHMNLVYDELRNKIVLFGGVNIETGFSNETWEWSDVWTKSTTSNAPQPRIAFSAFYSNILQKSIFVGGVGPDGNILTDIWGFDGQNFELLSNEVPGLAPGPGNAIGLAISPFSLFVFGRNQKSEGQDNTSQNAWVWSDNVWTGLEYKDGPLPRENHMMVFDPKEKRVLLFGGDEPSGDNRYVNPNTLWAYKNGRWSKLKP